MKERRNEGTKARGFCAAPCDGKCAAARPSGCVRAAARSRREVIRGRGRPEEQNQNKNNKNRGRRKMKTRWVRPLGPPAAVQHRYTYMHVQGLVAPSSQPYARLRCRDVEDAASERDDSTCLCTEFAVGARDGGWGCGTGAVGWARRPRGRICVVCREQPQPTRWLALDHDRAPL